MNILLGKLNDIIEVMCAMICICYEHRIGEFKVIKSDTPKCITKV